MWGNSSSDGDPFRVLGLDGEPDKLSITDEQVKASYLKLAKELHPDMNGGSEVSKRRFQSVAQAYSRLATKDKRRELFESRGSFSDAAHWGGVRRGHSDHSSTAATTEDTYAFFKRNKFRDVSGDFNTSNAAAASRSTRVDRWMSSFERFVHPRFLMIFIPLAGITYLSWTAIKRRNIFPFDSKHDSSSNSSSSKGTVPAWFNKKTNRFETPQPWNPDFSSSLVVDVDRHRVALVRRQQR